MIQSHYSKLFSDIVVSAIHPRPVNPVSRQQLVADCYSAFKIALKNKVILKPNRCDKCGIRCVSKSLHAHHLNYSKPLYVQWQCPKCHAFTHAVLRLFERTISFEQYCASQGISSAEAFKLPMVSRTGRQLKTTWYQHWRRSRRSRPATDTCPGRKD